jgi:methionyl-tRNA formyltransferase
MARLVFLGTPEAAVAPLRSLVDAGHEVTLVVTRADKRRGRGSGLVPSPVKVAALELGLPVTSSLDDIADSGAELGVVVAYGRIIPVSVLDRVPMVNLHFSLLPRWRGAAPVERAILEGDAETGVCLMAVEAGLDTGAIYAEDTTVIDDDETADELRSRLVVMGCGLLDQHLSDGRSSLPRPRDQLGTPSYAEKILPGELELHWEQPALQVNRVVRLGRAWTTFRGRRLGVVRASTVVEESPLEETSRAEGQPEDGPTGPPPGQAADPGTLDGAVVAAGDGTRLRLVTVQPEGKRPMDAADWLRGVRPEPGERLGATGRS